MYYDYNINEVENQRKEINYNKLLRNSKSLFAFESINLFCCELNEMIVDFELEI